MRNPSFAPNSSSSSPEHRCPFKDNCHSAPSSSPLHHRKHHISQGTPTDKIRTVAELPVAALCTDRELTECLRHTSAGSRPKENLLAATRLQAAARRTASTVRGPKPDRSSAPCPAAQAWKAEANQGLPLLSPENPRSGRRSARGSVCLSCTSGKIAYCLPERCLWPENHSSEPVQRGEPLAYGREVAWAEPKRHENLVG